MTSPIGITSLGSVPYARATALQRCLWQARCDDAISDTLLLLSHPPTISLGRRATAGDILAEPAALCRAGVSVWLSRRVPLICRAKQHCQQNSSARRDLAGWIGLGGAALDILSLSAVFGVRSALVACILKPIGLNLSENEMRGPAI